MLPPSLIDSTRTTGKTQSKLKHHTAEAQIDFGQSVAPSTQNEIPQSFAFFSFLKYADRSSSLHDAVVIIWVDGEDGRE
jgi:hypothetical protein